MGYTRDTVGKVWAKARPVHGVDDSKYRQDERGSWIARERYGCRWSPLGWEIEGADESLREAPLLPVHWERTTSARARESERELADRAVIAGLERLDALGAHKKFTPGRP